MDSNLTKEEKTRLQTLFAQRMFDHATCTLTNRDCWDDMYVEGDLNEEELEYLLSLKVIHVDVTFQDEELIDD